MSVRDQATASLIAMAPKLCWNLAGNLAFVEVAKAIHNDADVYLRYQLTVLRHYDIGEECKRITAPVFRALGRCDYVAPYTLWTDTILVQNWFEELKRLVPTGKK